jgi:hypothetical protein
VSIATIVPASQDELARYAAGCDPGKCLDTMARPQITNLLRGRSDPVFVAFDILELENRDLRCLPLVERKKILKKTI